VGLTCKWASLLPLFFYQPYSVSPTLLVHEPLQSPLLPYLHQPLHLQNPMPLAPRAATMAMSSSAQAHIPDLKWGPLLQLLNKVDELSRLGSRPHRLHQHRQAWEVVPEEPPTWPPTLMDLARRTTSPRHLRLPCSRVRESKEL
jgi:hypothetical protein